MKLSFILWLLLFPAVIISALPDSSDLLDSLDPVALERLKTDEHVFRYDDEKAGIRFLPGLTDSTDISRIQQQLKPEVMVEGLYLIPWPAELTPGTDDVIDIMFKLAFDLESISNVRFYPDFGKRYKILFSDVYTVDNPVDRNRTPAPEPPESGENYSLYVHMDERMLGSGYYRIDLIKSPEMLTVKLTNESALGFLFKAVNPRELRIVLHIYPCNDVILAYGYAAAIMQDEELIRLILEPYDAFYRRLTAVETWLYNSLHGTDRDPPVYEPLP